MTYYRPLYEVVHDHIAWAQSDNPRVRLGYPMFDSRTNGVAVGEMLMFLARSGTGKTAWACNVAVANRFTPQVFFSLEMDAGKVAQRMAAIYTDVPTASIEQDITVHGDSGALEAFTRDFQKLAIIDRPGLSLKQMGDALGEITEAWGGLRPRLVIVDYLELIKAGIAADAGEGVDKVSRKAKDLAREWQVALVLLHQLKKGDGRNDWGPITRSDARYGGDTAADYTLGAYRPGMDPNSGEPMSAFYLQFLKTRASGGLHPHGAYHHWNEDTLKITPPGGAR